MSHQAIREVLLEALRLKELPRAGWVRVGIEAPESVAAHSWGVAWLVLVLCPPHLDRGRALAIAVVHDLAEVRTGDITPHDDVAPADKQRLEADALTALVGALPRGPEIEDLWRDYDRGLTAEGRFVKACDKLDMALQAQRYAATLPVDTAELVDSALSRLEPSHLRALVHP